MFTKLKKRNNSNSLYLLDMVVQAVVVLLDAGNQIIDGIGDLLEFILVNLGAVQSVAYAYSDSLNGLSQIFLTFLHVREVSVIL